MAVVGFDVGTFSSYIGVARAGGIETIANEYSDRCTPSYISLNEQSRSMGAAAKQQAVTNFKNTVIGFKRVLGRSFKDPMVKKEMGRFFRPNVVEEDKDGNPLFRMSYMGEIQSFTAPQLQAMLLTKLKQTAETALKTKVVDAVISVPVYFTDCERRALLDACVAAGLNCLRLINDTTAAALGYGITKQDLPSETEKPRIVVFADLGYSALQVSACAFQKGKLKVLATSCCQEVGGRDFDEVLARHFSAEFRKKYKIDPESASTPKPFIRLLQECERLKKLMSANTQAIPLNIECFMEDKDVTSKLSRAEFEEMSAHLLQRIEQTLANVLTAAKLKPNDVHSVEILGGSSRIPSFKHLVSQVFSREPSTTLNADEAVARGCALQCAILSPTFRVRDFSITDCQSYPITLTWVPQNQMDEDSRIDVFSQFHQAPSSKMLTFYRREPFVVSALYTTPANVPLPSPHIGQFKVNGVTSQANGESSKVKVKVRINGSGIFSVAAASMYEKVEGEEEKNDPMEVDENEDKKDAAPSEEPMQTDKAGVKEGADKEAGAPQSTEDKSPDESQDKQEEGEKKGKGKKKNKVKSTDLVIDSTVPQLSKEALNLLTEKEGQMIMQDRLEKEKGDAKNSVEEYVYYMRDKLCSEYEAYMKEEERSSLMLRLEDTENWLYEEGEDQNKQVYIDKLAELKGERGRERGREGEDQNKQVYIDKLAELKKTGQPVEDRFREAEMWPEARDQFGSALIHIQKFLSQYSAGDEKFAHLDKGDVAKVQKCLEEKMAWWGPKMEAQSRLKPCDPPALLVSQVMAEKKVLESTCSPIMNKPKPKAEPPAVEEKGDDPAAGKSGSGDSMEQQEQPASGEQAAQDPKAPEMDVD
ncbi:hypothetical protein ACOMHN_016809 [Nucella lapillus]